MSIPLFCTEVHFIDRTVCHERALSEHRGGLKFRAQKI
jgi:hypothetical protein